MRRRLPLAARGPEQHGCRTCRQRPSGYGHAAVRLCIRLGRKPGSARILRAGEGDAHRSGFPGQSGPIDEAVTLTTPAGSSGRHWPLVWIPAIQQGIWPNLAARNTMFGGEDLADVMLYGGLSDDSGEHGDNKLESVLYAEQKSLLVALTRASEQVTASAVYNDDLTPSDFLYGYMPERFNRERHASAEGREYTQVGEAGRLQGLDADPRGLVAAPAWRSPYTHEVPRNLKMPWMRCDCWQAMVSKPLTSRVGRSSTRSRMRLPAPARWDRGRRLRNRTRPRREQANHRCRGSQHCRHPPWTASGDVPSVG